MWKCGQWSEREAGNDGRIAEPTLEPGGGLEDGESFLDISLSVHVVGGRCGLDGLQDSCQLGELIRLQHTFKPGILRGVCAAAVDVLLREGVAEYGAGFDVDVIGHAVVLQLPLARISVGDISEGQFGTVGVK